MGECIEWRYLCRELSCYFFLFLFLFLLLSRGVVMEGRRMEHLLEIGGNPSSSASNITLIPANTCAYSGRCHANLVL